MVPETASDTAVSLEPVQRMVACMSTFSFQHCSSTCDPSEQCVRSILLEVVLDSESWAQILMRVGVDMSISASSSLDPPCFSTQPFFL